jgi:signal transduction histidine kinase
VSAQAFLSAISQAVLLVLFAIAAVRLSRRFSLASLDTFGFFGVIAALLIVGDIVRLFSIDAPETMAIISWVGIVTLPYLLLRLADDFRPQPSSLMLGAAVAYVAIALVGVLAPQPWSPAVSLLAVAFFVVLGLYASLAFLREAMRTTGVTRRRMLAVAVGSGILAGILLLAGVRVVWPAAGDAIAVASQVAALVMVFSYFVGFAPPAFLRRAWQEPALRTMLSSSPDLVRLPDPGAVASYFEQQAVAATGAEGARMGLWDEAGEVLVFGQHPIGQDRMRPGEFVSGRAFAQQRTFYTSRPEQDAPEHAEAYRRTGIQAVVSTPVTSAGRRLGVLTVYAARPPAFTDDVVRVLEPVAEQAALVLRSQQLLQEAAHVQALAEVTRLKNDFLSVVAHDVRTPLTTILLNVEMMQQSNGTDGTASRRLASLHSEAIRLRDLVEEYLGLMRAEEDQELRPGTHDLVQVVRENLDRMPEAADRVRLSGDESLIGEFDERRISQLVENLVGNALKYSDADVEVELHASGTEVALEVRDRGIGIPDADLPRLFERFHRGTNTDDRRHSGMGLGLYICRQVAEAHGGTISVSSRVDEGTQFVVRLPRLVGDDDAAPAPGVAEPAT